MEGIGFWDIAPRVYLVGLALAFVLIWYSMSRPEVKPAEVKSAPATPAPATKKPKAKKKKW